MLKVFPILITLVVPYIILIQDIKGSETKVTNLKNHTYYENYGGDFSLTGPEGMTISLEDFRKKVVLVYFGYTFCPDVCPITLSKLRGSK